MNEQIKQTLPDPIFDRLMAGHSIAADVVTIAAKYRIILEIPISDYQAAVTVIPLMEWETASVGGLYHRIYHPETFHGFKVLYREVPEQYLEYGFDYDLHATFEEETTVGTREELEEVLSRYVPDFTRFHIGYGLA